MRRIQAEQPRGLFTRTAAKISAMTALQYVKFVNLRPLDQVKYVII